MPDANWRICLCVPSYTTFQGVIAAVGAETEVQNVLVRFQITMESMKSDIDEVALQGIEFWSNVCDEEVDLAIELSEVSRDRN